MKTENSFTITEFIRAKRDRVFDAWSNPKIQKQWDCPEHCKQAELIQNAVTGGSYRNSMIDGDEIVTVYGTYLEVIRPEKLVFTSQWVGGENPETLVTVEFFEKDDGTEIRLTQSGFTTESSTKGHAAGWASCLSKLAKMAGDILSNEFTNVHQEPLIKDIGPINYVGMAIEHDVHQTAKGGDLIPQLWDSFLAQISKVPRQGDSLLGVSSEIRAGGLSTYVAAVQVPDLENVPAGMLPGTVAGGKYAIFTHHGPIQTFAATVSYIHNTWMPEAGYKNHDCAQVEIMKKGANVDAEDFEMSVLVRLN